MTGGRPEFIFGGKQAKIRFGEEEIRFVQEQPFPLYPGEKLMGQVKKQPFIPKDTAFLVQALADFTDNFGTKPCKRSAGEQWLVKGPKTYNDRVEVKMLSTVRARNVGTGCALMLMAQRSLVDANGVKRKAGERWLIRQEGAYLPRLYEQVIEIVKGVIITHNNALQVRAKSDFTDYYGTKRRAGEEWLITNDMAEVHIVDVYEESVKTVYNTILSK